MSSEEEQDTASSAESVADEPGPDPSSDDPSSDEPSSDEPSAKAASSVEPSSEASPTQSTGGAYRKPRNDTKPLVVIRELHKSFLHMGRALEVLKGIDLEIHEGEVVAIVGKSGAGKSTLLQCIGTLDMPSTGIIRLGEHYLVGMSRADLARVRNHMIGFVFQFHHLLPEFNALENVMMPGLIQGLPRDEVQKRARGLLEDVGLAHRETHRPGELSGGEQQRVALARALLLEPKLILADEPTGNLDTATSDAIHKLFFGINEKHGTTIVVVTHNTKLAESMPRIIRMLDGRVEHDTDPPRTHFAVEKSVLDRSRALAKVRYSGFWNRAGARMLDLTILFLLGQVAFGVILLWQKGLLAGSAERGASGSLISGLLHPAATVGILLGGGVLALLAQGLGEWTGAGTTLGKLIFGLRVRMEDLELPKAGGAVLRNLLVTVDGLFLGLVAFLGIRSSLLRQRFGDGLAQTVVVDSRSIPADDGSKSLAIARGIITAILVTLALHAAFGFAIAKLV